MGDKMMKSHDPELVTIEGFRSIAEFEEFENWINELLARGSIKEVPVKQRLSIVEFPERWFQDPDGNVWRLVSPDFPFRGVFRKVGNS